VLLTEMFNQTNGENMSNKISQTRPIFNELGMSLQWFNLEETGLVLWFQHTAHQKCTIWTNERTKKERERERNKWHFVEKKTEYAAGIKRQ